MKDQNKTKKQLIDELVDLRTSEKRFRDFFANAPIYRFLLLDADLKIVVANDVVLGVASFLGAKSEDLIGKSFADVIPGFRGSERHAKYLEVLKTGIPFHTEEMGSPAEAGEVKVSALVFKAGDGLGIISRDITKRLEVERSLRESEQKYVSLVEQASDGVVILQDGLIKFASKTAAEMLGYGKEEVLGVDIRDPVAPEYKDVVAERHRLRTLGGQAFPPYEVKVVHRDGTVKFVEAAASVIQYEGRPASLAILRDVSERKSAEQALHESENRFRALFEGSLDATFLADPDSGQVVDANPAACDLLLKDHQEIVGLQFTRLFSPHLEAYVREKWTEILEAWEEPCRVDVLALRSDGYEVPVEGLAQVIQVDGVPYVHGNFRDVSKQRAMEDILRKSEERYRVFFDEAPTALWEIDGSAVKEYCDWLQDIGVSDLKTYFEDHPEEAVWCEKKVRLVEMNKASMELFEAGSKEELLKNLNRVLPRDASPPFSRGILAVADGKTSFERQVNSVTLNGKKKFVLYKWSVLPGSEKTFSRMLVSLVDITDRIRLEQEILRTQKLESLGVLAGGIAHDFNNLLTAISTNISMALMYGSLENDISEMLGDAEKASLRAKNLTQQLLTFAKGGQPLKKTVAVWRLLAETADFALSGSNVKSVHAIPQDLWNISADEGQIGQVIHNLVINADQAMPGGGEIRVSAENVLVTGEDQIPLKEGRYVKVSVEDQGIGISKKHLNSIFDPFFTTKQKGSGLGLTTCFTIVKNHGGHIRVDSEVDAGTRVDVFLPASEEGLQDEERDEARSTQGEGRILLIDDEEMIRRSAGEMLRRFGYEVTLAKDGEEGIREYRAASEQGSPFQAVILDLTIRGGNGGIQTVKELMRIDPNARVVVSSGYSDDPVMSNYEAYGFRDVIAKPYKLREVADTLRRVISERS